MSIFAKFLPQGATEQRTLTNSAFVPPPSVGIDESYVGVHRAMSHLTVMACVRLLADTIASLPWKVYKRDGKGVPKEVKPQPKIITQPCMGFDLFQWKWMVIASMALRGNSYHYVAERDINGYPTSLLPLHPDIVFLERRTDMLRWFDPLYRIMGEQVPNNDMIHMRRFTLPGEPWGLSPIRQAAVAIGMGLSAEEYGYRYFKESANPSGILSTEQDLDDAAIGRLQKNWVQSHGGRRMPAFLTGGFKWQTLTITPEESQFLACVVKGTPMTMADGTRKPVEELRVGEQVMAWNGSKLEAAPVKAIGMAPIKEIVKVTTVRGRELVCTADHPMLGLRQFPARGDAEPEWISAGELQRGNYVRAALGHLAEDRVFSPSISYLLGALVADGNIRPSGTRWVSGDPGVIDRMRDVVEELGGSLRPSGGDREYSVCTNGWGGNQYQCSVIRGILNESGLIGTHSYDKFVPELIVAGGPAAWKGFLSGYFDGDGSITPARATATSTSRELLDGLRQLFALLGVNAAIHPGKAEGRQIWKPTGKEYASRRTWQLTVNGANQLTKLAEMLDLSHTEKRKGLAIQRNLANGYRTMNYEYDRVKSVEFTGPGESIGVEIANLHTHVTGGLISHNTRQFQRSEICMMYGVPPILIGDTKETTAWGTGVEQITLGAVTYTFRAWTACIESVISGCLPRGQFVRFDYDALLRGDLEGRYGAYEKAVGSTRGTGWLTRNEVRAKEEMDPIDGGDILLQPNTMVPAGYPPAATTPPPPATTPGTLPMPPVGGGEDNASNTPARNGKPIAPAGR